MNQQPGFTITLEPRAGYSAAPGLTQTLKDLRQKPVLIDAGTVEYIGVPCLEVIMSAAKTWKNDAVGFQLINPTDAFNEGISLLGISLSELGGIGEQNAN